MKSSDYYDPLYRVVRAIPAGRVMSYGQAAFLAGCTSREAGRAMANVPDESIPWHRVVGSDGQLRIGKRSPVLATLQKQLLQLEGIVFHLNDCVDMNNFRYHAEDTE